MIRNEECLPAENGGANKPVRFTTRKERAYIYFLSKVFDSIMCLLPPAAINDMTSVDFPMRCISIFMPLDEFKVLAREFRALWAEQNEILRRVSVSGGVNALDSDPALLARYLEINKRAVKMIGRVNAIYRDQVTLANIF